MVRDAMRCVRERDYQHVQLLTALEIGERDIAAGCTVPYTPDLLNHIEQKARTLATKNHPANPDVVIG